MVQAGANRVQMEGKGLIQYTRQKVCDQCNQLCVISAMDDGNCSLRWNARSMW